MSNISSAPKAPGGLRERKKAKSSAAIQQQAMRLFTERGYEATTVEQIAEAAEVSPDPSPGNARHLSLDLFSLASRGRGT